MKKQITMHRAEKYACDSRFMSEETRTFFMKNFGCKRKVYNLYVDTLYKTLEASGYQAGDPLPKIKFPEVSSFKKDYPYLKEADTLGLSNAKIDFTGAVKRYNEEFDHKTYTKRALTRASSGTEPLSFKGLKGMPKFHSKARGDFSYKTNNQHSKDKDGNLRDTIRLDNDMLHLPKIPEDVKLIMHRPLPDNAVIGNVTVSMDTDGMIYASIEYSYVVEMDFTFRDAALCGDTSILSELKFLGLDYAQADFYVDSEGGKANYPHYYKQSEEKLARLQRQLSHMEKGSMNYCKKLMQIKKFHKKIRNQRKDYLHKLAAKLTKEYDVIVVEDIDLRAMGGALKLGKNLHDNGFGMFRDILSYKLEEKGSVLVKIDKWYPSTKTCHHCGNVNPDITMDMRSWVCPACGAVLSRDENAAINIREEGKRIFLSFFSDWLAKDDKARQKSQNLKNARKNKKKRGSACSKAAA